MPQRTNAFQRLVTLLTATLAGRATVTESAMLTDRVTREEREVDILLVAKAGGYTVRVGIEVISWSRPADTPWIEKMLAKHQNLPTDKLVLVSERGFYEPAHRKAEFYGVELLTMEEASVADWNLIDTLTPDGFFETMTVGYDVEGVIQLDEGPKIQIPIPRSASFPTEKGPKTIDELVRSMLDLPELRDVLWANMAKNQIHDFWFSYTEPNGLWRCEENDKVGQILELRVGLKAANVSTPVRYGTGKFRSIPFVTGASSDGKSVQFVLTKHPDGTGSGFLVDQAGIRQLSSKPADSA